jgi:hypothetical protein
MERVRLGYFISVRLRFLLKKIKIKIAPEKCKYFSDIPASGHSRQQLN